jgi:hypothetical protein
MNVHMLYFYGFWIYCFVAVILGVRAAIKKDNWMSVFGVAALTLLSILAGAFLLFILSLATPYGSTWP